MGMGSNCFPAGRRCEVCHAAAALLFCGAEGLFMCLGCDARVHTTARHSRVWMCEVCEQAAASVTCKADAAALCVTCDRDIHSANPLALRHERVPVVPFTDPAVKPTLLLSPHPNACVGHHEEDNHNHNHYAIADDPWVQSNAKVDFLFSESDNILDLDYSVSLDAAQYNSANDSVVPVQQNTILPFHHQHKHFEIDFTQSHIKSYTPSLCPSVSSSSLDVGVVPEGSSYSEISYPFGRSSSSNTNTNTNTSEGEKLIGMDREARVLRYREKRKNRKFEKTIRYASRKAYAETRPRIKGRFAKRTTNDSGVDSDIDQLFSDAHFIPAADLRYGVVPSFLTH